MLPVFVFFMVRTVMGYDKGKNVKISINFLGIEYPVKF